MALSNSTSREELSKTLRFSLYWTTTAREGGIYSSKKVGGSIPAGGGPLLLLSLVEHPCRKGRIGLGKYANDSDAGSILVISRSFLFA